MRSGRRPEPWPAFHADAVPLAGERLMRRDRDRLLALERDPGLGPSLFLYRWREPTVTLGYNQRPEDVLDLEAARRAGVPVVRRPTGGRAILHAEEWTYAAVVALDDPAIGGGLGASVRRLLAVVADALAEIGVDCVSARGATARRAGRTGLADEPACFALAVGYELTVEGRKLVGSAQRRLARALLQQGSILVGPGYERLAEFLAGGVDARARARARLLCSAVTVRQLLGEGVRFADFARALERAWARGGPGTRRREATAPRPPA